MRISARATLTHRPAAGIGAAVVGVVLLTGAERDETDPIGGACSAAAPWRDAAEAFEEETNSVDKSTPAGRAAMSEAFGIVPNIAIPPAESGSRGGALASEMHAWNALAEEWLSSVSSLYFWVESGSRAGGLSDRGQQAFLAAMSDQGGSSPCPQSSNPPGELTAGIRMRAAAHQALQRFSLVGPKDSCGAVGGACATILR